MFLFGSSDVKKNIIKRLKTFSQITTQYKLGNDIYRSGKRKYFSQIAKRFKLEGCPVDRPTCRLPEGYGENIDKNIDVLEPIWYSPEYETSKRYCSGKPDCTTYVYSPRDSTLIKNKRLLFLDLTGWTGGYRIRNNKIIPIYKLDETFMRQIYNYIYEKYKHRITFDEDDNEQIFCVDSPCKNVFELTEISSAYGYYGFRNSEMSIDRFFTLELFHLIKELDIEKELNCIIMGYYHDNLLTGEIDKRTKKSVIDSYSLFPAEFVIKYEYAINKNCIEFKGELTPSPIPKSIILGGYKKTKRQKQQKDKNNKKTKTTKRQKQ